MVKLASLTLMGSLPVAPPTRRDLTLDPWTFIPEQELLLVVQTFDLAPGPSLAAACGVPVARGIM